MSNTTTLAHAVCWGPGGVPALAGPYLTQPWVNHTTRVLLLSSNKHWKRKLGEVTPFRSCNAPLVELDFSARSASYGLRPSPAMRTLGAPPSYRAVSSDDAALLHCAYWYCLSFFKVSAHQQFIFLLFLEEYYYPHLEMRSLELWEATQGGHQVMALGLESRLQALHFSALPNTANYTD